jgi:hypothetical protein
MDKVIGSNTVRMIETAGKKRRLKGPHITIVDMPREPGWYQATVDSTRDGEITIRPVLDKDLPVVVSFSDPNPLPPPANHAGAGKVLVIGNTKAEQSQYITAFTEDASGVWADETTLWDPATYTDEEDPDPTFVVFLSQVIEELTRARAKFSPHNGPHESYAVMLEELDEFWDEVKDNNRVLAHKELIQVAAMAFRAAIDVYHAEVMGFSHTPAPTARKRRGTR